MKICIIGSYLWNGKDIPIAKKVIKLIFDALQKYNDMEIISGECPKGGVDIWAKEEALDRQMDYMGFFPEGNSKPYYMKRNKEMAKACDVLFRVASQVSKTYGSGITMKWASEMGKPVLNIIVMKELDFKGLGNSIVDTIDRAKGYNPK